MTFYAAQNCEDGPRCSTRLVNLSKLYCPDANIPLLRKGLEWAETEAALENGKWRQDSWYGELDEFVNQNVALCASSYCYAGNIVAQAGDKFLRRSSNVLVLRDDGTIEYKTINDRAVELLNISYGAGHELFNGYNSIEDLRVLCEAIAGEKL